VTGTEPEAVRLRDISRLTREGRTTALVIGGGINGIGVFRELALQGVDVLLVERDDFASGASAASSHMVHGGVRYLENGELRLVKESVQERNRLLKLAPHRVRPLETTIPIFSTFSGILSAPFRLITHRQAGKPRERGALLIRIGLTLYDLFSRGGGIVPRHRFRGRRRSLAELPALNPHVRYTATYFDAAMDDPERLALDVLHDGIAAGDHAIALNYVEATSADARGVRLRDVESGAEFSVAADIVINATGPWADLTNAALGSPTEYLGGTKGSHIVVDDPALFRATGGREIFFENEDGRIVLIYPLHGRVLIGTTDIEADPRDPARCTPEEVDYFVRLVSHVFPAHPVDPERIVYSFAGIRPLPRSGDMAPGLVSRDYRVESDAEGAAGVPVLSLVGGKWTTFRAVSEHLADAALRQLQVERRQSSTTLPLSAGVGYPSPAMRDVWLAENLPGVALPRARILLQRYGVRCVAVAAHLTPADRPLAGGELSTDELAYLVREEAVLRLVDVVARRTNLAFRGLVDEQTANELAEALGSHLEWTPMRRLAELDETLAFVTVAHLRGAVGVVDTAS
jgi:glycerol-3-phosphate dehydrogenase